MTWVFAMAKKPSLGRRSAGLSTNIPIFCPSLTLFPRPINICFLNLFMVPTLRENTLLRVSPILFLNFVPFYFGFGADIEDLTH